MLLSVYTFTCYALSVAPVTYYNCFYRYCDSHCCDFFCLFLCTLFIYSAFCCQCVSINSVFSVLVSVGQHSLQTST